MRGAALALGRWLDHSGEMLHALQAFALALTAEVKDELADSKAAIGGNIRHDLLCGAGEGPPFEPGLMLYGQRGIVERRFVGDREPFRVTSNRFCQALEITQRDFQLVGPQRYRRIGTLRVPAIAITRRPAQRRRTMAANPDRRVRFLYRMWETV